MTCQCVGAYETNFGASPSEGPLLKHPSKEAQSLFICLAAFVPIEGLHRMPVTQHSPEEKHTTRER